MKKAAKLPKSIAVPVKFPAPLLEALDGYVEKRKRTSPSTTRSGVIKEAVAEKLDKEATNGKRPTP